MSFRYHATLSPKPHFNKKEFIVEGWSEKELLKTLGDINDRYFTVARFGKFTCKVKSFDFNQAHNGRAVCPTFFQQLKS